MSSNKQAHYFSHDYNARNDEKMLELRSEFGWEGYGLFFAIVELMSENSGHLNFSKPALIAMSLQVDVEKIKKLLSKCIEVGLFFEHEGLLRSKRLDAHFELRLALSEYGRKGGLYKPPSSPPQATLKPPSSHKGKESKESKESKGNEIESKESKMVKPTRKQVRGYFADKGWPEIEADAFYDRSMTIGWKVVTKVGVVPMQNWKNACNTWMRNYEKFKLNQNGQPTAKNKSEQRFDNIGSLSGQGNANR